MQCCQKENCKIFSNAPLISLDMFTFLFSNSDHLQLNSLYQGKAEKMDNIPAEVTTESLQY